MLRIPQIKDNDWQTVRQAIQKLGSHVLGTTVEPTFAGLTLSSMTKGSILFAGTGGLVSQDNSNLFWDDTNNRLGIGTATPNNGIQVDNLINFDDTNKSVFLGTNVFNKTGRQFNVGIGHEAGRYNHYTAGQEGDYNVYIGSDAGRGQSDGTPNKGYRNVGVGQQALLNNTTGYQCMAVGQYALRGNTVGYQNTAVGSRALYTNNIGYRSTAIGFEAGHDNSAGNYHTYIGSQAGYNVTRAGSNNNTAIGYRALYGTDGLSVSNNVIIGFESGYTLDDGGDNNTFIGYQSGYTATTAASCVQIGYQAGYYNVTDSKLFIDNQSRTNATTELLESLIVGTFSATIPSQEVTINGDLNVRHHLAGLPDEITATDAGVAASVDTINTEVITNGDQDLDDVTLADGTSGQIKNIYCVALGHANDTWKITPANMVGGTQITFTGVGQGCSLVYADNEGWVVTGNNGGTIA